MIRILALCACVATACRSDGGTKARNVVDSASQTAPSSTGSAIDSGAPADPVVDAGPTGEWQDCDGRLTLTEDAFSWDPSFGSCTVVGTAQYAAGELTLTVTNEAECGAIPWWLRLAEEGPAVFAPTVVGTRLALIPTTSPPTARIAQFEEALEVESWTLTSDEGITSMFRLCWSDGAFFGGGYRTADGDCDFLSCGGGIVAHDETDMGEHWTTACQGSCPCGGVVTVEERSERSLAGRFFGSNCARNMSGTFSGVPTE